MTTTTQALLNLPGRIITAEEEAESRENVIQDIIPAEAASITMDYLIDAVKPSEDGKRIIIDRPIYRGTTLEFAQLHISEQAAYAPKVWKMMVDGGLGYKLALDVVRSEKNHPRNSIKVSDQASYALFYINLPDVPEDELKENLFDIIVKYNALLSETEDTVDSEEEIQMV
jgi:hypothetical protein